MRAVKILPHYTIADYLRWEGEWELIDGIPWAMTPSPIKKHSRTIVELTYYFAAELKNLRDECANCELVSELDWHISEDTVLRPDISIVCNETGDYIKNAPVLVIEILSPNTAINDRNVKFKIYEEQRVPYYIIVDPETLKAELFVMDNGKYVPTETPAPIQLPNGCTFTLDLGKAFADLA